VVLCWLSLDAVNALLPAELPRLRELRVDALVVAFAAAVSLLSCAVFGSGPALLLSRASALESLRAGALGSPRALRLRSALVIGEVALALALLIDATLLSRSLRGAQRIDPGFSPAGLQVVDLTLPAARYPPPKQPQFEEELLRRVSAIPGVTAASFASPLGIAGRSIGLTVAPRDHAEPHPPQSALSSIAPGTLPLLGVPMLEGRDFTAQDNDKAPSVVIINRTLARLLWPSQEALGKRIQLGPGDPEAREVVAVVGDTHATLDTPAPPQIYAPYAQVPWPFGSLVMRSALGPAALREELRREIAAIDSTLPVALPRSLDAALQGTLARRGFLALVLTFFAGGALLLAVAGVYGALSYLVAQRRRELAIRSALGASPAQVLLWVLRQGVALGSIGVLAGLGLALASSKALSAQVFGISATDPSSYGAMGAGMLALSAVATLLPALASTRSDPAEALRTE
jgi:putative ABC transport system permease protein